MDLSWPKPAISWLHGSFLAETMRANPYREGQSSRMAQIPPRKTLNYAQITPRSKTSQTTGQPQKI